MAVKDLLLGTVQSVTMTMLTEVENTEKTSSVASSTVSSLIAV